MIPTVPDPTEHHIAVRRTARYWLLGSPGPEVRELWVVLHGYGQLAERFIRHFQPIATPERLIVAPEALSRFYHSTATSELHLTARVGASWMTREDRLAEMADQINYLDRLAASLAEQLPARVHRTVLGFSQGAIAAARWARRSELRLDRLVLWGAVLPDELEAHTLVGRLADGITWVRGSEDPLVASDRVSHQEEAARAAGVPGRVVQFAGGHRLDPDALRQLAHGPPG